MKKTDAIPHNGDFRAWCDLHGMTRELVAEVLERDARTVSRIWAGERDLSRPEWEALKRSAQA